jgi:hypothetical protein
MATTLTLEQANALAHRFYSDGGEVSAVSHDYDRTEIISFLNDNVNGLCSEVEGMSAVQLAYKLPGMPTGPDESGDEEHFDTAQIMTHMASAIAFHWWNITRALRHERPPMPKPPEGTDVTGKKKNAMGGGGWHGLAAGELCKLLRDTTHGFVSYVNQLPENMGDASSSFGLFKDMTPHDWLFVVAVHAATHLVQVREMKARPDFPDA